MFECYYDLAEMKTWHAINAVEDLMGTTLQCLTSRRSDASAIEFSEL